MGEKFEVLDETGRKTGRLKERSLVHKEGDWHGALEVHLVDPKDQTIVFQQRGFDKDTEAGKIGAAAAGHYAPGEDFKDGLREVQEEIGIKVKSIIENPASIEGTDMEVELEVGTEGIIQKTRGSLTRIKGFREAILDREEKKDDSGKVLKKRIYNRELQNTAVLLMNIDMKKIKMQKDELHGILRFRVEDINDLFSGKKDVIHHTEGYRFDAQGNVVPYERSVWRKEDFAQNYGNYYSKVGKMIDKILKKDFNGLDWEEYKN